MWLPLLGIHVKPRFFTLPYTLALQAYMSSLALWAAHYLGDLWGVPPMAPDEMYAGNALVNVQVRTLKDVCM